MFEHVVTGGLKDFVRQHQNLCESACRASVCHAAKLDHESLVGATSQLKVGKSNSDDKECPVSVPNGPPVSEIIPHLFIGNKISASDEHLIDTLGIKYILNVTKDHPNYFQHRPDLAYKQILVNDSSKEDIGCHFEDALHFIGKVKIC